MVMVRVMGMAKVMVKVMEMGMGMGWLTLAINRIGKEIVDRHEETNGRD